MKNQYDNVKTKFKKKLLISAILIALPTAPMARSYAPPPSPPAYIQYTDTQAIDRYFLEKYDYCDSKVLAQFWGHKDFIQAKITMGNKILNFGGRDASLAMDEARIEANQAHEDEVACSFEDGGFSYNDAVTLAQYWGIRDIEDTKIKMDFMMVRGEKNIIRSDLTSLQQRPPISRAPTPVPLPPTSPPHTQPPRHPPQQIPTTQQKFDLVKRLSINADRTGVTSVSFSPDNQHIITGGWENNIKIWNANTGRLESTIDLTGKGDLIIDLAVSPDGKLVATANRDYEKRANMVSVHYLATGKKAYSLNRIPPDICSGIGFSSNGKHLAASCFDGSNGDRTLQVWDAQTGKATLTLQGASSPMEFAGNGEIIAASFNGRNGLKAWQVSNGEELGDINGFAFKSIAFSSDNLLMVGGGYKGELQSWDTDKNETIASFKGHTDIINGLKFSPNGKLLASVSKDKTLRLWQVKNAKLLATFHASGEIETLDFSSNGQQIIIGGMGGKLDIITIKQTSNRPRPQNNTPQGSPTDFAYRINFHDYVNGESVYVRNNNEVILILAYNNNETSIIGYKQATRWKNYQWQITTLDNDIWYIDKQNNLWANDQNGHLENVGLIKDIR